MNGTPTATARQRLETVAFPIVVMLVILGWARDLSGVLEQFGSAASIAIYVACLIWAVYVFGAREREKTAPYTKRARFPNPMRLVSLVVCVGALALMIYSFVPRPLPVLSHEEFTTMLDNHRDKQRDLFIGEFFDTVAANRHIYENELHERNFVTITNELYEDLTAPRHDLILGFRKYDSPDSDLNLSEWIEFYEELEIAAEGVLPPGFPAEESRQPAAWWLLYVGVKLIHADQRIARSLESVSGLEDDEFERVFESASQANMQLLTSVVRQHHQKLRRALDAPLADHYRKWLDDEYVAPSDEIRRQIFQLISDLDSGTLR